MSSLNSKNFLTTITVLFCVALSGCSKKNENVGDPKARLAEYINTSFSVRQVSDRTKLESYLSGGAKNRLVSWSDEQFRQAFVDAKRELVKLSVREIKPVSPNRTDITYELTYVDQGKGPDVRVTTKRMCEMALENGTWFIREVKNIKELIEYRNEVSIVY